MRQCRDCDDSCPFYYSDSYTEDYGCTLFGPEFKNNKLLDEDGVCHVPQIRIDYLAHMKNRYWALLEKQSNKYTSSDRKPATSKNYTDGKGYKVVKEGRDYDIFLFPYSNFYRPNMKGGHRHNHIRNAHKRMRKCHICGDPIVRGCEVISDWTNAEFMCRECCRNDAEDYCSAVGIDFGGVTFQTRRR